MEAEKKKIACGCGCGERFVPKYEWQLYMNARHANRVRSRRLRERAKLATRAGLTVSGKQAIA
jgi:hypothetical protein